MSERRLYTTVTGDGGGVRTRVDTTQCSTEIRFMREGLSVLGATLRIEFPLDADKPVISLTVHGGVLGDLETVHEEG